MLTYFMYGAGLSSGIALVNYNRKPKKVCDKFDVFIFMVILLVIVPLWPLVFIEHMFPLTHFIRR